MTNKKNIQNDWKTEREDIDEINYEEEAVTLTEHNKMAASVDLATDDSEINITKMKYEYLQTTKELIKSLLLLQIKLRKDARNYQNNTQNVADEKNIQNDWKTDRKDINEINYEKEAVTLTEHVETVASVDLATETDIIEMKYEDLMQASKEQIDNSSDFVINKTTDEDTNKITQGCQITKREIMDEKNAPNYQDDTLEMTDEKIIQKDWKTDQKDINEINYEKEAVTLTECNKTAASVDLATDTEELCTIYGALTDVRPYKCEVCKKKFAWKSSLTVHKCVHSDVRPYKCNVCEKKFARKKYLILHKRVHSNVRPYKCDVCEKKFTRKDYLILHERVHNGERPYKCDICEKKFARKDYLTVHKRVHSKVQPYKCDVCSSSFKHLNGMKQH
ncbi:PREDICTED: zinc finger protein 737-like [Wasmannia auropunctata]|uniref:zinc finger protein 737-like n=1 Tax=Wasmannia auropunctata TaxID=64793 RepID=UPI0005EED293|nr:PREDICTED: zinc finger protein 737-like [Wasmannia auropunctata]